MQTGSKLVGCRSSLSRGTLRQRDLRRKTIFASEEPNQRRGQTNQERRDLRRRL